MQIVRNVIRFVWLQVYHRLLWRLVVHLQKTEHFDETLLKNVGFDSQKHAKGEGQCLNCLPSFEVEVTYILIYKKNGKHTVIFFFQSDNMHRLKSTCQSYSIPRHARGWDKNMETPKKKTTFPSPLWCKKTVGIQNSLYSSRNG